ncbi:hypothetical protein [uncultured Robinsoniella sp.]
MDKLQKEPVTGDEIIMWPAPFVNGIMDKITGCPRRIKHMDEILSPLMK